MKSLRLLIAAGLLLFGCVAAFAGQSSDQLLKKANELFTKGKHKEALKAAAKAIELEPKNPQGYVYLGAMHQALRQHEEAIADWTKALKLKPDLAELYHRCGLEYFKLGQIKQSIRYFDKYIELEPKRKASHWQRGISYYYAEMYKEGREQFEGYQTFDSNDVENAVWRYMCMVPLVGKKKARKEILEIGEDKRVPMKQVYDLFASKCKPKDVLEAAKAGKPSKEDLNRRLFYAHLYLGLYYETEGNAAQALEHLEIAVKHPISHYMWDVARLHRDMLLNKKS